MRIREGLDVYGLPVRLVPFLLRVPSAARPHQSMVAIDQSQARQPQPKEFQSGYVDNRTSVVWSCSKKNGASVRSGAVGCAIFPAELTLTSCETSTVALDQSSDGIRKRKRLHSRMVNISDRFSRCNPLFSECMFNQRGYRLKHVYRSKPAFRAWLVGECSHTLQLRKSPGIDSTSSANFALWGCRSCHDHALPTQVAFTSETLSGHTIQWVELHQYQQTLHFSALSPLFTLPLTIPSVVANHFTSRYSCNLYLSDIQALPQQWSLLARKSTLPPLPNLHPKQQHFTSALSWGASITELTLCNVGSFSAVAPIHSYDTNVQATSCVKHEQ
jgi:hypothetical protein